MPFSIYETSPKELRERATESEVSRDALYRQRDSLAAGLRRAGALGVSVIGKGWTVPELVDAIEGTTRAIEGAVEASRVPEDARRGGAHSHPVGEDGVILSGGAHPHAFLWEGLIVMTRIDGEHSHEGDGETEHEHFATLPNGKTVRFGPALEEHSHETLGRATSFGGSHQHETEIDGETVRTLSPEEFRALFSAAEGIAFSDELADELELRCPVIPTGRRELPAWLELNRSTEAVRAFLTGYASGWTDEARASEALRLRLEDCAAPHESRVTEAVGERQWRSVVMRAGKSKNRNFWPASVLRDRAVELLEGAPLEAIKFDPRGVRFGHSPFHPATLKAGLVGNAVGQLFDVRFDPDVDGNPASEEEIVAIAKKTGRPVSEIRQDMRGAIVATLSLDKDATWLQEKLESAAERGSLAQYLGLSVDFEQTNPMIVPVPNDRSPKPLVYRGDVSGEGQILVDFVTRPSAGGAILEAA